MPSQKRTCIQQCTCLLVMVLCSFFWGGDVALVHTYLHIRILGAELRYVRMWYIIRHTKTKRSRTRGTRAHGTRHACRLFFWDVSIRNSLRSNKTIVRGKKEGVKIDKAQAGSMYQREQNLRRELFLFLWFPSFGECL